MPNVTSNRRVETFASRVCSDVNKDLGLKAKIKAKDLDHKAKVKVKD